MCRWEILSVVILVFAGLASCTKTVYVPVNSVQKDSIYINSIKIDSVYIQDSIFIDKSGDTIREYRYRYVYKYKDKIDTVMSEKIDSIQVPYPVEVVKYKTPQWCWWALGGVSLLLVPYIVKLINKLKGLGFLKI